MEGEWPELTLREAGVQLLDCEHRTPPATAEGFPYVAIPQVRNGRISLTGIRRISPEDFTEWTRKTKPQAWDVVLSRRCNPGETALVPPDLECALGQNLVVLRSNGKMVHPPFLRWLLRGPAWWDQVRTFINVGAVFESLKCSDIPNFRMPIPPMLVQQAIASILGTLDDKIELNRRMNETLEAMARAIFKSWFVVFDPVRAKMEGRWKPGQSIPGLPAHLYGIFPNRLVPSELGPIPEGWELKALGDVADLNWGDTSVTKKSYSDTGFTGYSAKGPDGLLSYYDFDRVGVVVSAIGANSGYTWLARGKWSCIKNTIRFWATDPNISTEFLFLATHGENIWPQRGSAQPFISQTDARNLQVLYPAKGTARVFGQIVEALFTKVEANERGSSTLGAIRDTLLPKLLSGEIRVAKTATLC